MKRWSVVRAAATVLLLALLGVACTSTPGSNDGSSEGAAEGVAVGDRAPSFTLPTAEGGQASLSDFRGQPVLLYFSMGPG